jgi:hypothetical protein
MTIERTLAQQYVKITKEAWEKARGKPGSGCGSWRAIPRMLDGDSHGFN